MENPQKENGYTPIANEILEALSGIRIPGEARQCLDIILRKTYGFRKKEDRISLSQFCSLSKMPKSLVCRALLKLEKINLIIIKKDNEKANLYRFNKHFSTWRPLSKKIMTKSLSKKIMPIIKKDNASLSKRIMPYSNVFTKETTTKETITKGAPPSGASLIPLLIKEFEELNPTLNYGNKTQRKACEELIGRFGFEKTVATLNYYKSIKNQKFSPTITTPYQLQQKLGELLNFYNKEKNNGRKITDISGL